MKTTQDSIRFRFKKKIKKILKETFDMSIKEIDRWCPYFLHVRTLCVFYNLILPSIHPRVQWVNDACLLRLKEGNFL